MIKLSDITLRRGTKTLLDDSSLRLDTGHKAGLVGRNGAGKTSLIKLLTGALTEDSGTIQIPSHWRIATLAQNLPASDDDAFTYVRSGDIEWTHIQQAIAQAQASEDGMVLAELYEKLSQIDGYSIDGRVALILKGLGFDEKQFSQSVQSFSGGWQMRLQLARILISRSDVLLLDEPTNHLDLETIFWLENWLKAFDGTFIVISHDRDFLDQVTTQTVYLANQKLRLYQGNYSSFARQFQEALILQQKSNEKIRKQKAHMQNFVDRFAAKASKAKQAQSRLKAIAKLQVSMDLQDETPVSFSLFPCDETGYPTISLDANLGYQDKTILKNVRLNVGDGDRIGVIGINGSGKSTLLKSIAGQIPVIHGQINCHSKTQIGYFSQNQLDMLIPDQTPMAHLLEQDPRINEKAARSYLGRYGFNNERVFQPVSIFSGGEKARLALALLIWQKPNVLILDEPTNHLDMQVREALILALQDFSGALLLVSHDRYFIECCVNQLWLVNHGMVNTFSGNLDDYQSQMSAQQKNAPTGKSKSTTQKNKPQQNKAIKQLEKDITKLQDKLNLIETKLAEPSLYENLDTGKIQSLNQEKKALNKAIDEKEQQWLALHNKDDE